MTRELGKHFAIGTTAGPDIANLQLNFWHLAVQKFEEIRRKWRTFAVEDRSNDPVPDEYTEDEFVVDAATAIVLAGTSVSQLVGQNVEPERNGRTPKIGSALKRFVGNSLPKHIRAFVDVYDDIRHLGPAKHEAIEEITEEALCQHMSAAQDAWVAVLKSQGAPTDDFRRDFSFE